MGRSVNRRDALKDAWRRRGAFRPQLGAASTAPDLYVVACISSLIRWAAIIANRIWQ